MLQLDPQYRLPVEQLLKHTWCQEGTPDPLPLTDDDSVITNLTSSRNFIQNEMKYTEISLKHWPFTLQIALDNDVIRLMAANIGVQPDVLKSRLAVYNYAKYDLATYFLLSKRKHKLGLQLFRRCGIHIDRVSLRQSEPHFDLDISHLRSSSFIYFIPVL